MPRVGTPNLNLGTWLQGENPGDGSQTVDNSGLNGNMLKIDRALGTQHNADGTHKANVIAGANLVQTGAGAVADGTTVEFSSNAMRIKDGGVTGAKLAAAVVDNTTVQLAAGVISVKTIGAAQMGSGSVSGNTIADGGIPTAKLEYLELLGVIAQTGTAPPTLNVIKSTFGSLPGTAYNGVGIYYITLTGLLTYGKTWVSLGGNGKAGTVWANPTGDGDNITVRTWDTTAALADGILTAPIVIRVYP